MPLELLSLGGFELKQDGTSLPSLGSRKAEALFLYLALEGRPVPRESLATLFWPDLPEDRGLANLSVALAAMRGQLDAHIRAERHWLAVEEKADLWIDAAWLEEKVRQSRGKAPLEAGVEDRMEALEEALDHYRGDFLAGFSVRGAPEFDAWALLQRESFRRLALEGYQRLARRALQDRRYPDALKWAGMVRDLDPLSEEGYRMIMRCHGHLGQWGQAHAAYQDCCEIIARELGVSPSYQTRELAEQLRMASASPRTNLPAAAELIGRSEELARLERYLTDPSIRLVTLLGPPGVGKSHLAQAAGERLQNDFIHGVFLVDTPETGAGRNLYSEIAASVELGNYGIGAIETKLLNFLGPQQLLLILDDAEHLRGEIGKLSTLLEASDRLKVLAVSQVRLGLRHEVVLDLEGLPYPENHLQSGAADSPAVVLYTHTARRISPKYKLTAQSLPAAVAICRLVDGNPLAIELAANWERTLSTEAIARKLSDSLEILKAARADLPPRQRSITAAFEYAWSLLNASEKLALTRLSIFPASFTEQTASSVAEVSPATLRALRNQSLLGSPQSGSFQFHNLLRRWVFTKLLDQPDEYASLKTKHARFFLAQAEQLSSALHGPEEAGALVQMDLIRLDLEQAWQGSLLEADVTELIRTGQLLSRYFKVRGQFRAGLDFFNAAAKQLHEVDQAPGRLAGQLTLWRTGMLIGLGAVEEAEQELEQAQPLFQRPANEESWALYQQHLGFTYAKRGKLDEAERALQESRRLYQAVDDVLGLAKVENVLGKVDYWKAALEQAGAHYEESARLYRLLGDRHSEALLLINSSNILYRLGRYEQAGDQLRVARSLFDQVGDLASKARALNNLGNIHHKTGDLKRAQALFEQSLALKQEIGDETGVANSLGNLGILAQDQHELQRARQLRHDALRLHKKTSNYWGVANAHNGLGSIALELGELRTAEKHFKDALATALEIEAQTPVDEALLGIARLHCELGSYQRAFELACHVRDKPVTDEELQLEARDLAASLVSRLKDPSPLEKDDGVGQQATTAIAERALQESVVAAKS